MNVALGEDWSKVSESAAWKDLEDNLRRLDQRLVQDVFDRKLSVEETEMARGVIATVLGLPKVAAEIGRTSRQVLEMEEQEWAEQALYEEMV